MKKYLLKTRKSYSIVEALLAAALFSLVVTAFSGAYIYGRESTALAGKRDRAHFVAKEGLEAVRNIRDNAWANLSDGNYSLAVSGTTYSLVPVSTPDVTDIFSRAINISTVDSKRKKITSTVTWVQNLQRSGSIALTTYLANWSTTVSVNKGGMLVYSNGGTTTDAMEYKIFDANTNTWSAAAATSDVDGATTNKVMRAAKLYSSTTRNEKILISRHYNGVNQYIYSQVWNGTTWNTPTLISTIPAITFLDVQNFDGVYLANGDFVTMYSDNTTTPKFRVWNGSVWGSAVSAQISGGVPVYIVMKVRPGTSEIMAIVFDNQSDTNSQYYDGTGYTTADWTAHSEHSTQAPVATKRLIDFDWSPLSPTKGLMAFSNNQNDRSIRYKVFTANGTGGGSWSNTTNGANQGSSPTRLAAMRVMARPSSNEFLVCSQNTVPQVICYRADITPTLTNPTNQIVATLADADIQKAYDVGYEMAGVNAIALYANQSVTPQIKKYNPTTNTFDAAATTINNLGSNLKTVRTIANPTTNDLMILLGEQNRSLSSIVWNGTAHAVYGSADAWGFNNHVSSGASPEDYYYDFAWDIF
ncbi:MAG: hypothetical protein WCG99_00910 [Candidatus Berkelbacteria bacterium]